MLANKPSPVFDVFLSYKTSDRDAVRDLKSALVARGLRVWLDLDELRPGLNCQPRIEQALRAASPP